MSKNPSVTQILAGLETQISYFEGQVPFHARQEAFHRAERERCESELAALRERYEALKAAPVALDEPVQQVRKPSAPVPKAEKDGGSTAPLKHLVYWAALAKAEGDTFGATAVAQEVNKRYAKRLRQPVNVRSVSIMLSRLASEGVLQLVSKGKARHEALYSRRA
ncbi:MAG TPA: hypothetical protein VH394_07980 [Thermoanaerobaculia bacterium]|jgi:hypothetical protein|nr:hypothetical protein [Thermoanaerobaculia bacterium]